jgi:spore photoproduct lyase
VIDTIYSEDVISEHPKALEIFKRFPNASVIPCDSYKEVFNPSSQNFRLQKNKPSLILAKKTGNFALPIPESYGIGGKHNFYFSHMLNCIYDCRYCFLQGMYPSANYTLFVNFEDFIKDIDNKTRQFHGQPVLFFSGYDCDSLAMENISGFVSDFLPYFEENNNAHLELRTKSVNIQPLLNKSSIPNIVTAFSFTPEEIGKQLENGVPSVSSRIKAMQKLAASGWLIGLRFDPIIDCVDFVERYKKLFTQIFTALPLDSIHSVSLGAFRMPAPFYKKMEKLYPQEILFAGNLTNNGGTVEYSKNVEEERKDTCKNLLLSHITEAKLFTCETTH